MINRFKKMRSHSVVRNSIALFALQLVSMIAPLIVLPYLARVLGIDGFGLVMLALSASAIGLVITDYGFNLSATYTISKNRDDIKYVSELIGAIFFIKLSLALLLVTSALLCNYFIVFWEGSSTLLFYICINVLVQSFLPTWFFQGIERMKSVTIYMLIAKVSYVLMVFLFVNIKEDVELVILLFALSNSVAAIIAIKSIYLNGYSINKPSLILIKKTFKDSSQFFMSRASVSIYTAASTFLVGAFAGVQQAALYGASEKLYQASQSVTSPISQALFPYMANHRQEKFLFKVVVIVGIPLVLGCLFVGFWATEVVEFIFGNEFYNSGQILQVFIIITVITFVSVNFGYPAFAGINKIHIVNYTVFIGAFIQLVLLAILYFNGGISALSVVTSVLITELIVAFLRVFLYFRYKKCE